MGKKEQKEVEIQIKKEELRDWLKEQLKDLEDKKKENFEKFEKVNIYFGDWNNDLIDSVCKGDMRIEDYMNLYKEWKLENLKALKSSNVIQGFDLVNILPNYEGINSLNRENLQKLEKAFWFRLPLSQLESLNKINISDQRLKQIEELRTGWKCGALEIEDPKILDASYGMPIDLMKQCIESGAVKKDLKQFLTCKSWELKKMIQCNQYLGITFSDNFLKDHRKDLRFNLDEFDLNGLKEIRNLFGSFFYDLGDIKGQQFKDNIEIFKQLTQREKELCGKRNETVIGTIVTLNNEFNMRNTEQKQQFIDNLKRFEQLKKIWNSGNPEINISDIVALNKLSDKQYQKVIENVKKLQELGISIGFHNNIKFLSDDLGEEYMHKFYSGGIDIPFYPVLRLFHNEGIEFPKDIDSILLQKFWEKIAALIKPGHNLQTQNPDKLKEFLDIDRDGVQQLKEIGISLDLDFFVEDDRENFEYKKITFKIQVENFKTIYQKYPFKDDNKWTKNLKKDIQQGCLYPREIMYLLHEYYRDQEIDWKTGIKEKFEREVCTEENEKNGLSLEKAIHIMDTYTSVNIQ